VKIGVELTDLSNFTVTTRCNSRCRMCNIWRMGGGPEPTLEQVEEFLQTNRRALSGLRFVQLTGGEPSLREDLPEIVAAFHRAAPQAQIWIPTNGLKPFEIYEMALRAMGQVEPHRLGITVSLDGEGSLHDKMRGVDKAYQKAIQTLQLLVGLKEKGLRVSTGFTMTRENFQDALTVQRISYRLGADYSFRPFNISKHYFKNTESGLDAPPDVEDILDAMAREMVLNKGLRASITGLAYIQGAKEYLESGRRLPCTAADKSVFVDAEGEVHPCIVFESPMGNIYEEPLEEILASKEAQEARAAVQAGNCPGCWLECEAYRELRNDRGRLLRAALWGLRLYAL